MCARTSTNKSECGLIIDTKSSFSFSLCASQSSGKKKAKRMKNKTKKKKEGRKKNRSIEGEKRIRDLDSRSYLLQSLDNSLLHQYRVLTLGSSLSRSDDNIVAKNTKYKITSR